LNYEQTVAAVPFRFALTGYAVSHLGNRFTRGLLDENKKVSHCVLSESSHSELQNQRSKSRRDRQGHDDNKTDGGASTAGTLRGFLLGLAALAALALLKILIGAFSDVALIAPDRMTFLAAI
jgi:hypothetical protein